MFDRCWRWRALLARRAEGSLSPAHSGMLQNHLAGCARCRQFSAADDALHDVLGITDPHMEEARTRAFDDRVVAALVVSARPARFSLSPLWVRCRGRLLARCHSLPLDFMAQIGGGAIAAVSLTSFFLLPALHSTTSRSDQAGIVSDKLTRDAAERAAFPVPMETLLNTPSPRAAMLWTSPERRQHHPLYQVPAASPSPALPSHLPSRLRPAAPQPRSEKTRPEKHSVLDYGNFDDGKAVG